MERRIVFTFGNVVLLLLTGMGIIGVLSAMLFGRAMLDQLGETAFPSVVSEVFWVCVWLVIAEVAVIVVMAVAFWLRRFFCRVTQGAPSK